jgi:hypothetical protein
MEQAMVHGALPVAVLNMAEQLMLWAMWKLMARSLFIINGDWA